jgi:hypothetical protein
MTERTLKLRSLSRLRLTALAAIAVLHITFAAAEPGGSRTAEGAVQDEKKIFNYWKSLISHSYVLADYDLRDAPPERPVKEAHATFMERFSQLRYTIYAAVSGKELLVALFDDTGHFLDYYIRNFPQQPDFELSLDGEANKVLIKEILNFDSARKTTELLEVAFSRASISPRRPTSHSVTPAKRAAREDKKIFNYWKPFILHRIVLDDYRLRDAPPERPTKEAHVTFREKFSQLQYTIYAAVSGKQLLVGLFDDAGHFLYYYMRDFPQQPDFELFEDEETDKVFIKEIVGYDAAGQTTELFEIAFSRPSISPQTPRQPASRYSGPAGEVRKPPPAKQIVVRLYDRWRIKPYTFRQRIPLLEEPEVFKKLTARLQEQNVTFDSNDPACKDIGSSAAIVILAEDQIDTTVKQYVGDTIYARPFHRGDRFYIPGATDRSKERWTFTDALGSPIPNAVVTIFLADYENLTKVKVRTLVLDDVGRLKAPAATGDLKQFYIVVSHLDYGIAALEPDSPYIPHPATTQNLTFADREKLFRLPLVKAGTKPDERSIWGVVLNNKGKPVPAAVIQCHSVVTLGGGAIGTAPSMMNTVLANELGQFAFHLPVEVGAKDTTAIPPNSKYRVSVEAPRALGLLPYSGLVPPGQETTIILEPGGYFRTFAFADANGTITDPNLLEEIFIKIERPEGTALSLNYTGWKNGRMLPPGTYRVEIPREHRPEFEPVEVTADAPEQIVFKMRLKPAEGGIVYCGQVIHAITGQPMQGVFIITGKYTLGDFATITEQQWQQLNQLNDPRPDTPAFEPVHQIVPFGLVLRTDINGQFEFIFDPAEKFGPTKVAGDVYVGEYPFRLGYLVAFCQDYLAVQYVLDNYTPTEPNENTRVELPQIRMYPAAKVIFEPNVEGHNCQLWLSWHLPHNNQPNWAGEFFAFSNKSMYPFLIEDDLQPNMVHTVPIPAGMNVQFRLQIIQHPRGWWCPIYTEQINAAQGQTIDLGRIKIGPEMPIYVKVIDSSGNPIEGLAVANGEADSKAWFGQRQITDPNGLAKFFVPPHYKAAFLVGWQGPNIHTPWQSLPYETKGSQDANNVFTMQLSEDVLEQLFKENKPQ